MFSPSLELETSTDSNLFQDFTNVTSADLVYVRPILEWRIPISRNLLNVDYRPSFKAYDEDVLPSTFDHLADIDWQMNFANRSVLQVSNIYERATRELRDLTDNEVAFNGQRFTRNDFSGVYLIPAGVRQSVEVGMFSGFLKFDEPEESGFYDYTESGVIGAWNRRIAGGVDFRAGARAGRSSQQRVPPQTLDKVSGETVPIPGFEDRDYTERVIETGVAGSFGRRFEGQALVGYGELLFDAPIGTDYTGIYIDASGLFRLTRGLSVEARASRTPNPSSFNVANYFVTDYARLRFIWATPRRLEVSLAGGWQANEYFDPIATNLDGNPNTGYDAEGNDVLPDPAAGFVAGVLRRDESLRLQARVEYGLVLNRASIYLEIDDEHRTSNIAYFDYDKIVTRFGLRFGWIP
jgi:hypothetical protein